VQRKIKNFFLFEFNGVFKIGKMFGKLERHVETEGGPYDVEILLKVY